MQLEAVGVRIAAVEHRAREAFEKAPELGPRTGRTRPQRARKTARAGDALKVILAVDRSI